MLPNKFSKHAVGIICFCKQSSVAAEMSSQLGKEAMERKTRKKEGKKLKHRKLAKRRVRDDK